MNDNQKQPRNHLSNLRPGDVPYDELWCEFGLTREAIEAARRYWTEQLNETFDEVPWEVVFLRTTPLSESEMDHINAVAKELVVEVEKNANP